MWRQTMASVMATTMNVGATALALTTETKTAGRNGGNKLRGSKNNNGNKGTKGRQQGG